MLLAGVVHCNVEIGRRHEAFLAVSLHSNPSPAVSLVEFDDEHFVVFVHRNRSFVLRYDPMKRQIMIQLEFCSHIDFGALGQDCVKINLIELVQAAHSLRDGLPSNA